MNGNDIIEIAELLGLVIPIVTIVVGLIGVYILYKGKCYYADEIGWTMTSIAVVAIIARWILCAIWGAGSNDDLKLFAETSVYGGAIAFAIGGFFGIPAILADTIG